MLHEHRDELDMLSQLLMERETIDKDEFDALLAGGVPEEVFRAKDEQKARKAEEAARRGRQRQPRERDVPRRPVGGPAPNISPVSEAGGQE